MIGLVVVILLTWLFLKYVVNEPISVLGIAPTSQRLRELTVGITFMAIVGFINFLWQADVKEITYAVSEDYSFFDFLWGSFWVFRSVLFEELLFRGVLLFLLIKYVGIFKGCLFSAITFGVYHWFRYTLSIYFFS